jgi:magnesium chelatase family protein
LDRTGKPNALLGNREVERFCRLSEADRRLLEQAMDRLALSARAYHRILRVARSIADLEGCEGIKTAHLTEAISYRRLDRVVRT